MSTRLSRRSFLVASTVGFAGLRVSLPSARGAPGAPGASSSSSKQKHARSTILFFLCGGASHIDTWDMKPDAPAEYRGPFNPIRTSAPGVLLCEHLPLLAKQAHHLAVIQGVTDYGKATGDHHAGYYYNLTGHVPDETFRIQGNDRRPLSTDWPYMGCVVGKLRPPHAKLPQVISLPYAPSKAPYTRPGQFAGRLGLEHDPFYLHAKLEEPMKFAAPTLTLSADMPVDRFAHRRQLLGALDAARREFESDAAAANYTKQQEKAFALLSSSGAAGAFDIASEPQSARDRYGSTLNGTSLLMARRLVEAGVPFITVFWMDDEALNDKCKSGGGWDTHANNFNCLRENLLPEFDRGFSALLEDLSQRGLLDSTLVMVSSEMGRKPRVGDPRSGGISGAGRDHWTACMSVLMAGGGVRGGQVYGRTDARAEYPADNPIGPEDITATVYHAMGIDDLRTEIAGRPVNLLEEGKVLTKLF